MTLEEELIAEAKSCQRDRRTNEEVLRAALRIAAGMVYALMDEDEGRRTLALQYYRLRRARAEEGV